MDVVVNADVDADVSSTVVEVDDDEELFAMCCFGGSADGSVNASDAIV